MHEHPKDDPELLSEIEKLGYDPRDVDVSQTPKHAIFLYVGCGLSMLIAWVVMLVIDKDQVTTVEPAALTRDRMPEEPYPILQSNITAKKDIEDLRLEEKVRAESAGWVDKEAGIAHIPVATAIDLLLEEGFPTEPAGVVDVAAPEEGAEVTDVEDVVEGTIMEDGQ